ncbi:MAG: sigma-70 family RNA polymerase sigma factor [Polyangiaceae bacterium]|nr:sigma-70 family RNA polymerase sigma factor [Polyangiaceae bacterium]
MIIRLTPFVRQIVTFMGVRACDRKDVVQNVMLGAWASVKAGRFRLRANIEPNAALRAWVGSIAVNQSLKWLDRAYNRREVPCANLRPPELVGDDPEGRYDAREMWHRAMRTLHEDDRAVLVLAAEGRTLREIATALGLRVGTAAMRLGRVRELVDRIRKGEAG